MNTESLIDIYKVLGREDLRDDQKQIAIGSIIRQHAERNPSPDTSLDVCPKCGGPADNGHDRCIPSSPYYCTKCTQPSEICVIKLSKTIVDAMMEGDPSVASPEAKSVRIIKAIHPYLRTAEPGSSGEIRYNPDPQEAYRVITALWQLLDDIDTQDDASKDNDRHFRSACYQIQQKRWKIYNPEDPGSICKTPPEPVSVSLEKCANALDYADSYGTLQAHYVCRKFLAKAVLDAAGVKYVD